MSAALNLEVTARPPVIHFPDFRQFLPAQPARADRPPVVEQSMLLLVPAMAMYAFGRALGNSLGESVAIRRVIP